MCFLKNLFRGRVSSHRWPEKLRQLLTSLLKKFDGQKTYAWGSRAASVFQAKSTCVACVGTWGTVPASTCAFGVVRRRQVLLSTWFPCLVPKSAGFGVFCVRQHSLPRVSARLFEPPTFGGTL